MADLKGAYWDSILGYVAARYRDMGDGTYALVAAVAAQLGQGKALLSVPIAQGAPGDDQLVAAIAAKTIYVVAYAFTLNADGTAKFGDGTADLTGAFDIVAKGGVAIAGQPSAHLFSTAAVNRPLRIITTGGAARGFISYFAE